MGSWYLHTLSTDSSLGEQAYGSGLYLSMSVVDL